MAIFDKYIPEKLKRIGDIDSLYKRVIDLFEKILSGDLSNQFEFIQSVEELYNYWDVLRNKTGVNKVRELLDPYGISKLTVTDEDSLSTFLYFISNIYATKGTLKSFRFALKTLGLDAEIIRWYEPEYLKYRPVQDPCRAIILIRVKNNQPIEAGIEEIFNKLLELLLDICLVIESWIIVKSLQDSFEDFSDYEIQTLINHDYIDYFDICLLNLLTEEPDFEKGIYGFHANPKANFLYVGLPWNPLYTWYKCIDHSINEFCPHLHDNRYDHCLYPPQEINYYPSLIHVIDTILRHNVPDVFHDGTYFHNQRFTLPQDYFECISNYSYIPPNFDGYDYPRHLDPLVKGHHSGTVYYHPVCDEDPLVLFHYHTFSIEEAFKVGTIHDGEFLHDRSITHKGNYVVFDFNKNVYETIEFVDYVITLESELENRVIDTYKEEYRWETLKHDYKYSHFTYHSNEFVYHDLPIRFEASELYINNELVCSLEHNQDIYPYHIDERYEYRYNPDTSEKEWKFSHLIEVCSYHDAIDVHVTENDSYPIHDIKWKYRHLNPNFTPMPDDLLFITTIFSLDDTYEIENIETEFYEVIRIDLFDEYKIENIQEVFDINHNHYLCDVYSVIDRVSEPYFEGRIESKLDDIYDLSLKPIIDLTTRSSFELFDDVTFPSDNTSDNVDSYLDDVYNGFDDDVENVYLYNLIFRNGINFYTRNVYNVHGILGIENYLYNRMTHDSLAYHINPNENQELSFEDEIDIYKTINDNVSILAMDYINHNYRWVHDKRANHSSKLIFRAGEQPEIRRLL